MENKNKFKTIDWVRKIRDNNYYKYKDMDLKQFVNELTKDTKKSNLWERVKKNKSKIKQK